MRENMLKETLKELFDRKRALFELTGIRSAILKGDLRAFHGTAVVKSQQTAIANGNAMDIRCKIFESSLTIANRFAMNNPLLCPDLGRDVVKEFQFLQTAPEGSPKQFGQSPHRQEEPLARRQPNRPIRVQAAAWGKVVHMRMIDQVAGPGVQDTDQPDLSADITRIKRKFLSSLGRSLKEQRIESLLIRTDQITQLSRQSESQEEIWNVQEQILLDLQPILSLFMLTFGAMAIATGVITVLEFLTFFTTEHLSTQALSTAGLNRPHCLTVRGQEFIHIFFSIVSAVLSKEIRQF
jgi:hypothetical protein